MRACHSTGALQLPDEMHAAIASLSLHIWAVCLLRNACTVLIIREACPCAYERADGHL